MHQYLDEAQSLFEYTQFLRRDFHRHPELGFQENRTAGIIQRELEALGLEVQSGIAKTGVVAILEGSRPGPVALLRFDMDALPVTEETGAEYASQNPGVMHACGHDGHMAIGITVARLLLSHRKELAGTIKLVFQPAEEGIGGADLMVAEGVLENPKPDLALAMHLWNEKPVGWLGIVAGPVMAASEVFTLRILGKGGHGGMPHVTIDPVLASAHVIASLQSIVSRNVSPLQTAVVSVTSVHGGEAFNVIPPQVEMKGTLRTFEPQVRELVLRRFEQIAQSTAQAFGCQAELSTEALTLAVVNDPHVTAGVLEAAAEVLPESILEPNFKTMGSEDMAAMMQTVPGCYFFVGSANHERGLDAGHHHPRFDFDEQVLPQSAALMAAAAARFLQ
jgi:amidohydrolase